MKKFMRGEFDDDLPQDAFTERERMVGRGTDKEREGERENIINRDSLWSRTWENEHE